MSKPYDPEFGGAEELPKVLNCKKCNSLEVGFKLNPDKDDPKHFQVICNKCGYQGPFESNFEKAIILWNDLEG